MTTIKAAGARLARAAAKRAFHARKYLYQRLSAFGLPREKRILFILGCQRSGTTLMQNVFDADLGARVYGEFSAITRTAKTPNLRLRPLEEVKSILEGDPARFVVAKPICETQNALRLLGFFPGAKALFLYRHYAAVASSNLREFGQRNGINNLRPIVAGESGNWRSEGVPPEVRALVVARFHEQMNPYDAAALFWYVRNRFFFDLRLDGHPAVLPLRYEDLLRAPTGAMEGIYRFVGAPFVPRGVGLVRPEPAGRPRIELSADIEQLCAGLLERLDRASARAWDTRAAVEDLPTSGKIAVVQPTE
ncbi:MAG TPA: sulfotransferase [Burkholderiales bacterium]|nr:sulfotransferase [Burkholderiales bacterium]